MVSKPAPNKDLSKSAKKNAARKAKRAADQQLKGESGSSGIQLAQDIAKVKITAEDASPKPVKKVASFIFCISVLNYVAGFGEANKKLKKETEANS